MVFTTVNIGNKQAYQTDEAHIATCIRNQTNAMTNPVHIKNASLYFSSQPAYMPVVAANLIER